MTSRSSHLKWNRGVATILAISLFLSSSLAQAQEASTPPVGVLTIDLPGQSDTIVSVPFHRPTVFRGVVSSHNGDVVTVQGTPGWDVDQFVFNSESQTNTYYLLVCSGDHNGVEAKIVGSDSNSVTIESIEVDIDGAVVEIIPYWTLNTVFEGNQGITPTNSPSSLNATKIIFLNDSTAGINLAASVQFYYVNAFQFGPLQISEGWRSSLSNINTIVGDTTIIPNDQYFIVRNPTEQDTQLVLSGDVRRSRSRLEFKLVESNVSQDNFIAITSALPISLSESGLYESGVFKGSALPTGSGGDRLIVYDNNQRSINKSQAVGYFYFDGDFGGQPHGWRKTTSNFFDIVDDEEVFVPGNGYTIRKVSESSPNTYEWLFSPNYLQSISE